MGRSSRDGAIDWMGRMVAAVRAIGLGCLLLAPLFAPLLAPPVAAAPAAARTLAPLVLDAGHPFFSRDPHPNLDGSVGAPAGTVVTVTVGEATAEATVGSDGTFFLAWPDALDAGLYRVRADVEGFEPAFALLLVQPEGDLPLRPLLPRHPDYAPPLRADRGDFLAFTDRWRIAPPATALTEPGSFGPSWDPYHQNLLKGDVPIYSHGKRDVFLIWTAVSDTLAEAETIPIPAGVSTARPGEIQFFGEDALRIGNQDFFLSADLYQGDTAFRPVDWRLRATLAGNLNHVAVDENAVVRPDVREGTSRTTGRGALQELFAEWKLADLSPNYDFLSVRGGIQPFTSDFRGFIFSDTNLGVRLFGNYDSNRWQYNLAWFDRLEKGTNSGLNTFESRDQQVGVANVYRQDFPVLGMTSQASVHYLHDEPTVHYDRNGFLVRPDPAGSATPHEIDAWYFGVAAFGHLGRVNVDGALYYVTGEDSLNPIAGPGRLPGVKDSVDIGATMTALELSIDRNWYRPKLGIFYASGDGDPVDRKARGFDAIFENPAFAGGGFSYWNRLGIGLAGTGVTLVNRGSLLPSLKSSKEEGQPNFVNPGLLLATAGLDLEVTPKLRMVATANYLRFDTTETLELLLFQGGIDREIGWDLSLGARYRPLLNENVVVLGGLAAFVPGAGWEDIYEDGSTQYLAFTNLVLTF